MSREASLEALSAAREAPRDPTKTAAIPLLRLDWLWLYNPGSLCNLACRHCLTLSSPVSEVLQPLETKEMEGALHEARELCGEGFSIGMTGGEVFLLAQKKYQRRLFEQLELALSYGPVLALSNAILASSEDLHEVRRIVDAAAHPLRFRVSLDGINAAENDAIRIGVGGKPTWSEIMKALRRFADAGFRPGIALTYDGEGADPVGRLAERRAQLLDGLQKEGLPELEIWGIPLFDQGFETTRREESAIPHIPSPRITEDCISRFVNQEVFKFQCSYSRAYAKDRRGRLGWYKCAVLPADEISAGSYMGPHLRDALKPALLSHSSCFTCFRAATRGCGMSCSG